MAEKKNQKVPVYKNNLINDVRFWDGKGEEPVQTAISFDKATEKLKEIIDAEKINETSGYSEEDRTYLEALTGKSQSPSTNGSLFFNEADEDLASSTNDIQNKPLKDDEDKDEKDIDKDEKDKDEDEEDIDKDEKDKEDDEMDSSIDGMENDVNSETESINFDSIVESFLQENKVDKKKEAEKKKKEAEKKKKELDKKKEAEKKKKELDKKKEAEKKKKAKKESFFWEEDGIDPAEDDNDDIDWDTEEDIDDVERNTHEESSNPQKDDNDDVDWDVFEDISDHSANTSNKSKNKGNPQKSDDASVDWDSLADIDSSERNTKKESLNIPKIKHISNLIYDESINLFNKLKKNLKRKERIREASLFLEDDFELDNSQLTDEEQKSCDKLENYIRAYKKESGMKIDTIKLEKALKKISSEGTDLDDSHYQRVGQDVNDLKNLAESIKLFKNNVKESVTLLQSLKMNKKSTKKESIFWEGPNFLNSLLEGEEIPDRGDTDAQTRLGVLGSRGSMGATAEDFSFLEEDEDFDLDSLISEDDEFENAEEDVTDKDEDKDTDFEKDDKEEEDDDINEDEDENKGDHEDQMLEDADPDDDIFAGDDDEVNPGGEDTEQTFEDDSMSDQDEEDMAQPKESFLYSLKQIKSNKKK